MADGRQNPITKGQTERINGKAAEHVDGAMRCGHCGLVYKKIGGETFRLGHLDNAILGEGFKPTRDFM